MQTQAGTLKTTLLYKSVGHFSVPPPRLFIRISGSLFPFLSLTDTSVMGERCTYVVLSSEQHAAKLHWCIKRERKREIMSGCSRNNKKKREEKHRDPSCSQLRYCCMARDDSDPPALSVSPCALLRSHLCFYNLSSQITSGQHAHTHTHALRDISTLHMYFIFLIRQDATSGYNSYRLVNTNTC